VRERNASNLSSEEIRKVGATETYTSLREEIEAFDQLPRELRRFLDEEARIVISAKNLLDYLRENPRTSASDLLTLLRKREEEAVRELDPTRREA
jgi:hypothetical protein